MGARPPPPSSPRGSDPGDAWAAGVRVRPPTLEFGEARRCCGGKPRARAVAVGAVSRRDRRAKPQACALYYALGLALHISGPLTIAVTGIFIGNLNRQLAMSPKTRANLDTF